MNFPVDPIGMGQLALIAGMPEAFYPGPVYSGRSAPRGWRARTDTPIRSV